MAHERFQAGLPPEDLRVEDKAGPTAAIAAPSPMAVLSPHGATLDKTATTAADMAAVGRNSNAPIALSPVSAAPKPTDHETAGAGGARVSNEARRQSPSPTPAPRQSPAAAAAPATMMMSCSSESVVVAWSGSSSFADAAGRGSSPDNDAGSNRLAEEATATDAQGSRVNGGGKAATAATVGVGIWQGDVGPRGPEEKEEEEEEAKSWATSGVRGDRWAPQLSAGSGVVGVDGDQVLVDGDGGGLTTATTTPAAAGVVPAAGGVFGTREKGDGRGEEVEVEEEEEEEEVRIRRKKRAIEEAVEG